MEGSRLHTFENLHLTLRPRKPPKLEVQRALASTWAGSSAGPDALPYSLWRVGGDCWAPLLAHLFTAMGSQGVLPPIFALGAVEHPAFILFQL
jgi:hypothetical protein